jgi:hypothetical protein
MAEEKRPADTAKEEAEHQALRRKFWTTLLERAKAKTDLHAGVSPNDGGWVSTGAGKSGLGYFYWITQHGSRVELRINRGKAAKQENKVIFDSLKAKQKEVERLFGKGLLWEPLEDKQACWIGKPFEDGGYRDDQAKWPEIQDAMIDAMVRLEKALHPFIAELKVGS